MNVIAWLEFELAYYDVAIQLVNNQVKETPTKLFQEKKNEIRVLFD